MSQLRKVFNPITEIITCKYNKRLNFSTTYTLRRDFSLITTDSLLHYINMTNNIDMVFSTENTNMIAETISNDIDTCINTISPAKLIQCTKNTVNKLFSRHIINENMAVTSIRKIASIANQHFINKIKTIRSKSTSRQHNTHSNTWTANQQAKSKFTIPYITGKQTKKLIRNMISSNNTGHDMIYPQLKLISS